MMVEMVGDDLVSIAEQLDRAVLDATAVPQIAEQAGLSLDDAYEVQRLSIACRERRGERLVGVKLGFTSRAKMAQMGLSSMIFGLLTDGMMLEEGGSVPHARFIHPRVEPEIAFRLKSRLAGNVGLTQAMAAVEYVAPAIEVLDSRYRDFKFSLADVVADNTSAAGFVVGPAEDPSFDIGNLGLALSVNGVVREIGSTAAILGNPWRSLVAAARLAAQYGMELSEGDIVMAGAATAAIAVAANDRVTLETQGMQPVQVAFSAEPR
jgi:2-oxo-3-hexenedioate decarboxylase